MILEVAEFKAKIDRYLALIEEEEFILTRDGKAIARITPIPKIFSEVLEPLRGVLPADATLEEAHEERIAKHEHHLKLACEEENATAEDGVSTAEITPSPQSKREMIESLIGTLPPTATIEDARAERLKKYETGL